MLLESGGYTSVASPQVGDVIVYYGPDATPLHSGRIKAVGVDGFAGEGPGHVGRRGGPAGAGETEGSVVGAGDVREKATDRAEVAPAVDGGA